MKSYLFSILFFLSTCCFGQESPNFLWLVCEDQSLFFSMYGDSNANTPNIDLLAKEATIYHSCYTPSPVCAPSRSSLITGMYPTTLGTQHMRAFKKSAEINEINSHNSLPYYSPKPKKPVRFFTEDLRAKGYYCTNNSKEDYNMITSPLAWDESSQTAHWRNRQMDQPFFSVFNFNITHESNIWKNSFNYSKKEIENIHVPDFFPENDAIKIDLLTNYKNIEKLDKQIGTIIDQLKADGLYENTIIFFFSDHGGPLPRYKRSIYETGLRVPMVVKWIDNNEIGNNFQLVSFVDFAPTILDVAKIEREFAFEGVSFFKKNQRDYIYAAADRFDSYTDMRRSIRGGNFKLIYNSDTAAPIYNPIRYRKKMKTMQVLDSLFTKQQLNTYFFNWFSKNKDRFELYNVAKDYFEQNNLINSAEHQEIFKELESQLLKWMYDSDFGNMTESQMLNSMFTSSMIRPKLDVPRLIISELGFIIESNNLNASIGWRNKNETVWNVYRKNDLINPEDDFEVIVFQPGYEILIKSFKK